MPTSFPGRPPALSTSGVTLSRVSRGDVAANGGGGPGATARAMACADEAMRGMFAGHGDLANAVELGRRVMHALDGFSSDADTHAVCILPSPSERADSMARMFSG